MMLQRLFDWLDRLVERTRLEVELFSEGEDDRHLVYKVVSVQQGDSVEIQRWSYNFVAHSTYAVQYLPGQFVSNDTPLLVFDNLDDAITLYQWAGPGYELWSAVGESPRDMPYKGKFGSRGDLMAKMPEAREKGLVRMFWQSKLWRNWSNYTWGPVAVFHPTARDRNGYCEKVSVCFEAPKGTVAYRRVKLLERLA